MHYIYIKSFALQLYVYIISILLNLYSIWGCFFTIVRVIFLLWDFLNSGQISRVKLGSKKQTTNSCFHLVWSLYKQKKKKPIFIDIAIAIELIKLQYPLRWHVLPNSTLGTLRLYRCLENLHCTTLFFSQVMAAHLLKEKKWKRLQVQEIWIVWGVQIFYKHFLSLMFRTVIMMRHSFIWSFTLTSSSSTKFIHLAAVICMAWWKTFGFLGQQTS